MQTALIAERAGHGKRPAPPLPNRRAAFERGRERWPSLGLNFEQFGAHLDRVGWRQASPHDMEALHIEALYLCAACCVGLPRACRELDRAYFPGLGRSLSMRYKRRELVEEVLQLTRERLLVKPSLRIATYRGTGCLQRWLRVIAQRVAADLLRRENSQDRRLGVEWQHWRVFDFHADSLADMDLRRMLDAVSIKTLEAALFEALAQLEPHDRRLLHLYYARGVQAKDIGSSLGIDRSTVYRRLHGLQRRVEASVRHALCSRMARLPPEELRALALASCMKIGLSRNLWDAVRA